MQLACDAATLLVLRLEHASAEVVQVLLDALALGDVAAEHTDAGVERVDAGVEPAVWMDHTEELHTHDRARSQRLVIGRLKRRASQHREDVKDVAAKDLCHFDAGICRRLRVHRGDAQIFIERIIEVADTGQYRAQARIRLAELAFGPLHLVNLDGGSEPALYLSLRIDDRAPARNHPVVAPIRPAQTQLLEERLSRPGRAPPASADPRGILGMNQLRPYGRTGHGRREAGELEEALIRILPASVAVAVDRMARTVPA